MSLPLKLYLVCVLTALTRVSGKHDFRTNRPSSVGGFFSTKVNIEERKNSSDYEVFNYTQTLDHFNFRTKSYTTNFQQRYVVMSQHWGGPTNNSPIFLYVGEERDIMKDVIYLGFPHTLASQFNALLVYIEHRYYGTSMPFGSEEEAYKNTSTLGYFTSEQALADYAQIITDLKKNMSAENSPVIAIGASYGGMLASWFRLKYPHIAYGALASSAPILYFMGLTPENAFALVISEDFNTTSASCYNTIRESWSEINRVGAQPNGLTTLSQMFNTCQPLNAATDLKYKLEETYGLMAMFDSPASNTYSIPDFCKASDGVGNMTYILTKITEGYNAVFGHECMQINELSYTDNAPGWDSNNGWNWQACTEMVMPMGQGENETMFEARPFDLDSYNEECQQIFHVTPRPYWIPTEFGGHVLNLQLYDVTCKGIKTVLEKFASNIIFSNGLRDPFSAGGVLQNISDTVVAIYTQEGHHCLDITTPSDTDPDWLVMQRDSEISVIQGWLSNYTYSH